MPRGAHGMQWAPLGDSGRVSLQTLLGLCLCLIRHLTLSLSLLRSRRSQLGLAAHLHLLLSGRAGSRTRRHRTGYARSHSAHAVVRHVAGHRATGSHSRLRPHRQGFVIRWRVGLDTFAAVLRRGGGILLRRHRWVGSGRLRWVSGDSAGDSSEAEYECTECGGSCCRESASHRVFPPCCAERRYQRDVCESPGSHFDSTEIQTRTVYAATRGHLRLDRGL